MKLLFKFVILWIRVLKYEHNVSKHSKKGKEISFKTNPEEFIKYLSEGEELKRRGYEIEEKLYNLKQKH